jgi:glycosyltransferase involved in cell wall biosynthesis
VEVKKIKILRIINRFNIGGPTYNATFLTAFLGDEFETMLVGGLPDIGEEDSLYIPEKYGVEPVLIEEMVRQPNLKSDKAAYKRLKEVIKEYQPDIVHTHASKAGALGRRAARACGVPFVVHTFHGHVFHSYFGKTKTLLFKSIERRLAKKTDVIVAISKKQKVELSREHKICEAERIRVIPLGFDLQQFHDKKLTERDGVRQKYEIDKETIAIGIIGRLAPVKNHQYFFEVINKVLERTDKKIKVFIVGDGPERPSIGARAKEINNKYGEIVVLTSWIKDIGTFNAGLDIICLTSKNEGTPVSLIEAQASGVPVITTDVGGVVDVVSNENTGYIIPTENQDLYVERLIDLIENEKKREKMSQNGWNFVKEEFTYDKLVENMRQLYLDLLTKK